MRSKLADVEVWLHHETKPGVEDEGAYLVSLDHKDKCWIPKVACEIDVKDARTGRAILTAPESYLQEKGLI